MTQNRTQDQWAWRLDVARRLDVLETKLNYTLAILGVLAVALIGPLVQKFLGG